jgi:hypothetical protein
MYWIYGNKDDDDDDDDITGHTVFVLVSTEFVVI